MTMHRRVLVLLLLAALQLPLWAAPSVVGKWKSSTGAVIHIPWSRDHFDMVYHGTNGQELVLHGHWYPDRVGTMFYYDYGGQRATCTFSASNPNVITVQGPNGVSNWIRIP